MYASMLYNAVYAIYAAFGRTEATHVSMGVGIRIINLGLIKFIFFDCNKCIRLVAFYIFCRIFNPLSRSPDINTRVCGLQLLVLATRWSTVIKSHSIHVLLIHVYNWLLGDGMFFLFVAHVLDISFCLRTLISSPWLRLRVRSGTNNGFD